MNRASSRRGKVPAGHGRPTVPGNRSASAFSDQAEPAHPAALIPFIALLAVFLILFSCAGAPRLKEGERPQALVLVADGAGWSYFEIVGIMEGLGWEVFTLGYTPEVRACANREERIITADFVLPDFDMSTLGRYHALIIPAGAHFRLFSRSEMVQSFIEAAWKKKLVIAAQCTAVMALARSSFIQGKSVASFSLSDYSVSRAGGVVVREPVVVDGRLVTAGAGGGPDGGGYENAHLEEFCAAIDGIF